MNTKAAGIDFNQKQVEKHDSLRPGVHYHCLQKKGRPLLAARETRVLRRN